MDTKQLQLQFPNNHIITDACGKPSVMVYVEKFYLDEVIDGAPHCPHPAFVVDGRVQDGIYISKFQSVIEAGLAYSLPDRDPATHVDFDTALRACRSKGEGFHLMTAMEWGAIALWCQKNGWLPYGNNEMGKDIREAEHVARIAYRNDEKSVCRTATGTGPVEWSHDRTPDGIYDLNANVWEWVGGFRLVRGELQVLPDNNGASGRCLQAADSEDWRAIDGTSGAWLIPDRNGTTQNSVKLDFIEGRWVYVTDGLSDSVKHARFCDFADVTADSSLCERAKELLYALGLLPTSVAFDYHGVSLYANNGASERIAFRGGRWGQGMNTGVFKTCLDDPRTYAGDAVGFRFAYCKV